MVADWRDDYNEHRPHSSLAMKAPARFARDWRRNNPAGDHRLSHELDRRPGSGHGGLAESCAKPPPRLGPPLRADTPADTPRHVTPDRGSRGHAPRTD